MQKTPKALRRNRRLTVKRQWQNRWRNATSNRRLTILLLSMLVLTKLRRSQPMRRHLEPRAGHVPRAVAAAEAVGAAGAAEKRPLLRHSLPLRAREAFRRHRSQLPTKSGTKRQSPPSVRGPRLRQLRLRFPQHRRVRRRELSCSRSACLDRARVPGSSEKM